MAVKIRMKRVGAKNAPCFRIVVADSRSPRDGKFIEEIGTYQPLKKGDNFTLKLDRAKYWVSKGAQPSDTVASFIKKAGKAASRRRLEFNFWRNAGVSGICRQRTRATPGRGERHAGGARGHDGL